MSTIAGYIAAWRQLEEAVVKDGQLETIRQLASFFKMEHVEGEDPSDKVWTRADKVHELTLELSDAVNELLDELSEG